MRGREGRGREIKSYKKESTVNMIKWNTKKLSTHHSVEKSDPRLWNSLLQTLRKCTTLTLISRHLKTRLTSLIRLNFPPAPVFSLSPQILNRPFFFFFFFCFCCSLSVSLWQLHVLQAWLLHEHWDVYKSYSRLQSPKCRFFSDTGLWPGTVRDAEKLDLNSNYSEQ